MLKFVLRGTLLLFAVLAFVPRAEATPIGEPPAGWIFRLDTVHPGALPTYTQFFATFTGTGHTEFVSFAFREAPAFFAFADPFVSVSTAPSVNLFSNPDFTGAVFGQNCNHGNSLGCPPGWGAWITPEDVSAIGQIATNGSRYGCNIGPHSLVSGNFWCDGSVQGYDAIYSSISTVLGATYNLSFWLEDDCGGGTCPMSFPSIDVFAYAGDQIPIGAIDIGNPTAPEPASLVLLGTGLIGLAVRARKAINKKKAQ